MNTRRAFFISFIFLAVFLFSASARAQTWTGQTSGTGSHLRGVYFTDANTGWVVGLDGTILKTTNGGTTWTPQTSNATSGLAIFFTDANTGWMSGLYGTLRKTTDGGANWTTLNPGTTGHLYALYFIDANNGWIGGISGASTVLRETTDGGTNWSARTASNPGQISDFHFYDANIGWAVNNGGSGIMKTTNGNTWSDQTGSTQLKMIQFVDANTGWAVGLSGIIQKTVNGGTNWTTQTSGTTNPLNGGYVVDANNAYAVGLSGTVRKTIDGTNWTGEDPGTTSSLYGAYFIDADTGWAVGDSGTIRKRTGVAPDTTAPADITTLSPGSTTTSTVILSWTAPGDDGDTGTAASYDIRYSTEVITSGNFDSATQVSGEPAPQIAGTLQSMTVTGLNPSSLYYFRMKTSDEVPNTSGVSNSVGAVTASEGGTPPPPPPPTPPPAPAPAPEEPVTGGVVVPDYITIKFNGRAYPGAQLSVLMQEFGRETAPVKQDTIASSDGTFEVEFRGLPQAKVRQYGIAISDKDGRVALSKLFATAIVEKEEYTQTIFASPTLGFSQSAAVVKEGKLNILGYATPGSRVEVSINRAVRKDRILAGEDGSYRASLSVEGLDYGTHTIAARQFDAQGTPSDFSPTQFFSVSRLALPQADLNGDGKISVSDFSVFLARWGSSDPVTHSGADLNGDGKVNISDFSVLIRGIRAR